MDIISWLESGDVVLKSLVINTLLDKKFSHENQGIIDRYLNLYNTKEKMWDGIYNPLWTSNHYTLLELKYMQINPEHPIYQEATEKLLNHLWFNKGKVNGKRYQDMCMSAMLLSLITYGKFADERIFEIIDYILTHQLADGGWNCAWDSVHNKSSKSSLHTTISVLEAFRDYEKYGYTYRLDEVKEKVVQGQGILLKRELFKNSEGISINQDMITFHYPTRYKYDCFRALEYFVSIKKPFDIRMNDAINLVKEQIIKGYINTGKQYTGKVHFKLENSNKGRFNTYRALLILKFYDSKTYNKIIANAQV
ncbi:prenyltransferase/squalene oxidase repeat-containing protein [Acholeplasma laidlawii]|uniref:hypothetical protein n=1 Tax=Acholeplasma laidlawii TaxID=2148 RepID=UPI0021F7A29A|nr:hypothetical protein [Acholeplasma laidlawii]